MTNKNVRASYSRADELPIKGLLSRLSQAGFKEKFVRQYALPDWWDDELSTDPISLAAAEISISRLLGISVEDLRATESQLFPAKTIKYRLKKLQSTQVDGLLPAISIAHAFAESLAAVELDLPVLEPNLKAEDIRREILSKTPYVDLKSLTEWAWAQGIIVAQLHLPKEMKRFAGIAMCVGEQPVIMLGWWQDSPSWLAFQLAHELGHIVDGHVGTDPIVDVNSSILEAANESGEVANEELLADRFAKKLLTGHENLSFKAQFGLTGGKLATQIRSRSFFAGQIEPGTLALIYGYTANRMGVAQNALEHLGLKTGGQEIIRQNLLNHIPDELPESIETALQLTGISKTLPHVF